MFRVLLLVCWICPAGIANGAEQSRHERVYPGRTWITKAPDQLGLDPAKLEAIQQFMGGRGCVVRHGYLAYTWGEYTKPGDVASAVKPWNAHFLFKAVEDGRLPSLDAKVCDFEPRLNDLNPGLGYKDRAITFRHMANQVSCYGVTEPPGAAFDYNDFQMALFWDTLFLKVYGATQETVDSTVLHPMLTDIIQCEDNPTYLAFGPGERAGRLAVSPRDFARFGLLYLREGNWNGRQVISKEHARMAVSSPLPNTIPRTAAKEAAMIPGQRTLGSRKVPDDQCDHQGSYSWLWWTNGIDREGRRHWPDAPADTYAALGHKNGQRGMAVFPSFGVILAWNDTTLGDHPTESNPLNTVFRLVCEAVR